MGSTETVVTRGCGIMRLGAFFLLILLYSPFFALTKPFMRRNPYFFARGLYYGVTRILQMRVRVFGEIAREPSTLYMSNHTSYLDVPVLGNLVPAFFVAKADVAHWPIFGFLTKLYNTVYVERKAARAAAQRDGIRPLLEAGRSLVIFPEGTSTDGSSVLPLKSSLFSLAEGALPDGSFVRIQPISIVCHAKGEPPSKAVQPFYAWYDTTTGDSDFLPHLWKAFQRGRFSVDVIFHPVLTIEGAGQNRKILANLCHEALKKGVEASHAGQPERGI